jgi:hypothetical protein
MKKPRFNNLSYFFGCYFNQDWQCDDPTPEAVIQRFLAENPPSTIEGVAFELAELLSLSLSEDELWRILFEELNCWYKPIRDSSTRTWLIRMQGLLKQPSGNG